MREATPESLRRLFDQAIELPRDARKTLLDRECPPELRRRLDAMLAGAESDDGFLADPPAGSAPAIDTWNAIGVPLGIVIGKYELLEPVGQGGFGSVYLAKQREPVQRTVALKIIKPGMDTRQVIARFELERQALAMMDHPNIARVLDAGATEPQSPLGPGRPYFVMEFVDGVPITRFCDEQRMPLHERLALFVDACHGVQHAHQKGIVHRDLKPSNVLASRRDCKPVVKIIDFGIAKATGSQLTDKTLFTEHREMLGTPAYMSPEQAGRSGLDIDTRSDIYSLGVLLYELLTGTTPFDAQRLRSADFDELRRIIREDDPPKPSTRVGALHVTPPTSRNGGRAADSTTAAIDTAPSRHTDRRSVARSLHGDLDWIVMKAIEKDRERRYETASSLALDVERYLRNEPVLACPPSRLYRLRKLVRRNRGMVVASALVAVALVAGLAGTTFGLVRAKERWAEAEAARKQTQRVSTFQAAMLRDIDVEGMGHGIQRHMRELVRAALARQYVGESPNRRARTTEEVEAELFAFDQRAQTVPAVDVARRVMDEFVLARAAGTLEEHFADQPLVQAQLYAVFGAAYRELGLYSTAETHFRKALAIRQRELGNDDPDTLTSLSNTGHVLWRQGKLAEAEPYYLHALRGRRRVLGDEHPDTLSSLNDMGELLVDSRPDDAEPYYREALAGRLRMLGEEHPDTVVSIHNIGYLLHEQGRLADAEPYYRRALELESRLGQDDATSLSTMHNLGRLLAEGGRFHEAEPYFRKSLAASRRVHGDEHPDTLSSIYAMGSVLRQQGKLDEAEPYAREALERARRILGDEHPDTLRSINQMGVLLQAQDKPDEAEPYFREALEVGCRTLGEHDRMTLTSMHNLGFVLQRQGESAGAERYLRNALDTRRRVLGDEDIDTLYSFESMGRLLQDRGRRDEARSVFEEGTRAARAGAGDQPITAMLEQHYADVLREAGDLDEAGALARAAVDRYLAHPDWAPREAAHARRVLAATLHAAGRTAEALAMRLETVEAMRQQPDTAPADLASALATYGAEVIDAGDAVHLEHAEQALRDCLAIRRTLLPESDPRAWLRYNAMSLLGDVLVRRATQTTPKRDTSVARLREAEPLLLEAWQHLKDDTNVPPPSATGGSSRRRAALQRIARLYAVWHMVEPDQGHDAEAARWTTELEAFAER